MEWIFLCGGIILMWRSISAPKTLSMNILKRSVCILYGIWAIMMIDITYLEIDIIGFFVSLGIGLIFTIIHVIIARGIKLRKEDVNHGLVKTSLLIYFLELPAEEFLYRGVIFLSLLQLSNPIIAIIGSSVVFLILHLKTWKDSFVWVGSFVLAIICCLVMIYTNSIWSAVIVHNLNDFGFLTLVNKRNIFKE